MHSSRLADGQIIRAEDYDTSQHGIEIYCIDKSCQVPVHFVREQSKIAFFKTSGKGDSVHKTDCAFASKMSFEKSVSKISEFQQELGINAGDAIVVRLNTNKIDPDHIPRNVERQPKEEEATPTSIKVKEDKPKAPQVLSTLKGLKKLFVSAEPDELARVLISVKGYKIPISKLINDYQTVHEDLWRGNTLDVPYFIHGKVKRILRFPKVWYINLHDEDDFYFTIVVFKNYFDKFTYTDEQLSERHILCMGNLRKNTFKEGKRSTEIIIKSNDYIEFLD